MKLFQMDYYFNIVTLAIGNAVTACNEPIPPGGMEKMLLQSPPGSTFDDFVTIEGAFGVVEGGH